MNGSSISRVSEYLFKRVAYNLLVPILFRSDIICWVDDAKDKEDCDGK